MTVVEAAGAGASHLGKLEQELLENWARRPLRVPLPVSVAAGFIAWLPAGSAPLALRLGWVALVLGVLLLRWWTIREAARRVDWPLALRFNAVCVVSGLGGVAHGLSLVFWPYMTEIERVVQSMFVIGLSAGAVATMYGHLRMHLPYMLPAMLPMTLAWPVVLHTPQTPWWQGNGGVMLLMLLLYAGLLITLARDTFALYAASYETRQRLMQALQQAESASRAKTRFLAAASHDLRQPMHTLSLFGAALSTRPLDEQSRAIAAQMNVALRALSSELDALLDISKLDAGIVAVDAAPFELGTLLCRLGRDFQPLAQRKGLLMLTWLDEAALADSDSRHVERVLRNLLDNAVKYTPHGEVALSLQAETRHVAGWRVEVRDTGLGIPLSELERVFEEFYQLGNPERDRTQGLGLGLAIVRRLCDLLKLPLTLQSALGQGTTFALWLPAAHGARVAAAPAAAQVSFAGLDVLVVDDEEAVRTGMQVLLEGLGCRVSTAGGCTEALARAKQAVPDMVLADFRLRGNDNGISVIQQLRQQHGPLPALLISGDTAPARLREAHAAGLRLLHKPLSAEQLIQAMGETLHESIDHRAQT